MNRSTSPGMIRLSDETTVWEDKHAKSVSFFCRRTPVRVDRRLVDELKTVAARHGDRNARVCLHESPTAAFHEMIIMEHKGAYLRPHKHAAKGESYHIIEGSMAAFVFDADGGIVEACTLDADGTFVYRVGADTYHAVMPLSRYVIYHEAKLGPFLGPTDSIFPSWAPTGQDAEAAVAYTRRLQDVLGG